MGTFAAAVRLALVALLRSPLRSLLTVLGILVGIASVVVVTALGEGASGSIGGRIESLGSNVVYVFDKPRVKSGARKARDRKSTRLNSSHLGISYAVFCL